jgi:hypothetical protein
MRASRAWYLGIGLALGSCGSPDRTLVLPDNEAGSGGAEQGGAAGSGGDNLGGQGGGGGQDASVGGNAGAGGQGEGGATGQGGTAGTGGSEPPDAKQDTGPPVGVWVDPANTELMWQNDNFPNRMTWSAGTTYCANSTFAGFDDWRLATIDELRTLVVGCADTAKGGVCQATESCGTTTCTEGCTGCAGYGGPGLAGCYWNAAIKAPCDDWAWASTLGPAGALGFRYRMRFDSTKVGYAAMGTDAYYAMCVRYNY